MSRNPWPAFLAGVMLLASTTTNAANYAQAPNGAGSTLAFAGTYQGEVFTGRIPGFATNMTFDPANLASARLDVSIPIANATTENADYDGEMRGKAFFDAVRFPEAHYQATAIRSIGGQRYVADGQLTLRGISKQVALTFTWTPGVRPVLAGKATVKRLDFGIGAGDWADTSLIANDIAISTRVVLSPAR